MTPELWAKRRTVRGAGVPAVWYGPCDCPVDGARRGGECPRAVVPTAVLRTTLAGLGRIELPCAVVERRSFRVGDDSLTAQFVRPDDGRCHRVCCTPGEVEEVRS